MLFPLDEYSGLVNNSEINVISFDLDLNKGMYPTTPTPHTRHVYSQGIQNKGATNNVIQPMMVLM